MRHHAPATLLAATLLCLPIGTQANAPAPVDTTAVVPKTRAVAAATLPPDEIALDPDDAETATEAYNTLTELQQQQLNVNKATFDDLMQIPFLTAQQANDIIEYRGHNGNLRTIEELAMIPSIDRDTRLQLTAVLTAAAPTDKPWYSAENLRYGLAHLRHQLTLTAQIPTYHRAGDRNAPLTTPQGEDNKYADRYLGDPMKHSIRYTIGFANHVQLHLTGSKLAGEPFFGQNTAWGYPRYNYNIVVNDLGPFSRIIVGDFRGQFALGLTFNNSFTLSKQSLSASTGRRANVFTPYSSSGDAGHLHGLATTVRILKRYSLSAFLSYRNIDGTLNADSTIATVRTSNYCRTELDYTHHHVATQRAAGMHIAYDSNALGFGASFVYTGYSRELNPIFTTKGELPASKEYRRYYPAGSDFWNASVDYRYHYRTFDFCGEAATGSCGNIALAHCLTWQTPWRVTITAQQRYFAYQYYTLLGSSFSEGGRVQNESGCYLGFTWSPLRNTTVEGYTDIAYFPWVRYQVSNSSYVWDNSVQVRQQWRTWTLALRYRVKMRQRDRNYFGLRQLQNRVDQRLRLTATHTSGLWTTKTQLEGCLLRFADTSRGGIVSQTIGYRPARRFDLYAAAAYFATDDYDSRLYVYERGPQYSFGFSGYYGRGIRAALYAKVIAARWLTAQVKAGYTKYFDRETLFTADRQVFASHITDIDLQLIFKL